MVEKAEGVNTAGMDICLCRMERGEDAQIHLRYAATKRPLFYARKASGELAVLEGDRQSIGRESKTKTKFTT